jgi:hypothetical protein
MASSLAATRSAVICVLLLLAASVSGSHGYNVLCTNNTPAPLTCQGVPIPVGATVAVDVIADVAAVVEVVDAAGNLVKGTCVVPADVTAIVFVYVGTTIQIKVTAVVTGLVGGLLNNLLGLVLATIVVVL